MTSGRSSGGKAREPAARGFGLLDARGRTSGTSTSRRSMSISCAPAWSAASRATLPWLWPWRTSHNLSGQFWRMQAPHAEKHQLRDCARTGLDEGCTRSWHAVSRFSFHLSCIGPSMSDPFGKTFASFFQAGFECSSHRRRDGVRLDLIRATGHDKHVLRDYRLCKQLGFGTIRDGLRWHLIEKSPGKYDWSSWLPALEAAEERRASQVIWDLFHYGSPDHVDQAGDGFSRALHRFRAGRGGGAAVGQRAPAARLPAERNQLPVVGGRRRLFPARRSGAARLVQAPAGRDRDRGREGDQASAGRTRRSSGPSR